MCGKPFYVSKHTVQQGALGTFASFDVTDLYSELLYKFAPIVVESM
jgi:hypothetical protein